MALKKSTKWNWGIAGVAGILAAVVGVSALMDSTPALPSVAEAETLVAQAWTRGAARDHNGLCDLAASQSGCKRIVAGDSEVVPAAMPTTVCERILPADGDRREGRALRVTGVDSQGAAYTSDVLAIGTDDGPRLMDPVFWIPTGISLGGTTGNAFDVCGGAGA